MFKAFGRLGVIAAVTLILAFLVVFALRQMGSMQGFVEPHHAWFKKAFWNIYTPELPILCARDFKPNPEWIIQLPVKHVNDRWTVPCPDTPETVRDYLSKYTHANWVLKVEATDTTYLDKLVENVGSFDKNKRFAVVSGSQRVSRYLRKKAPQWLYAADSASILRLKFFESIWLESVIDFWPDFVITPMYDAEITARSATELLRRHKRIVWDSNNSTLHPGFEFHGIMTPRPSEIEQFQIPK